METALKRSMEKGKQAGLSQAKILEIQRQANDIVQGARNLFVLQCSLVVGNCTLQVLLENRTRLTPAAYAAVLEERYGNVLCAYPVCSNTPSKRRPLRPLGRDEPFQTSDPALFCSNQCGRASATYHSVLLDEVGPFISAVGSTIN